MKNQDSKNQILILFISFCVGSLFLLCLKHSAFLQVFVGRSLFIDYWADRIAGGDWLAGTEVFYGPPLPMYVLGILYGIFGRNYILIRIIDIFLFSVGNVLLYKVGCLLFRKKVVGWITCLLNLFCAPLFFYSATVPLFFLPYLLAIWLLYTIIRMTLNPGKICWICLTGGLIGLLALDRTNFLFFIPVLVVFILYTSSSIRLKTRNSILLILTMLLTVSPVLLRNYYLERDFALNPAAGVGFYLGNSSVAKGATYGNVSFVKGTVAGGDLLDFRIEAERRVGKKLKPNEVSAYWVQETMRDIQGDPGRFLLLLGKKFLYYWSPKEAPDDWYMDFFLQKMPAVSLGLVNFSVLAVLGMAGFYLARGLRSSKVVFLLTVSFCISIILSFVVGRHRIFILPYYLPYAAFTIFLLVSWVAEKPKRVLSWTLIIIAVYCGTLCIRLPLSHERAMSGSAFNYALLHYQLAEYDRAEQILLGLLSADSDRFRVNYLLGDIALKKGSWQDAVMYYDEARKIDPSDLNLEEKYRRIRDTSEF